MAGFLARLFLVETAVDAGYGWLALLAVVAMIPAAIAAARLITAMYAERGEEAPFTMAASPPLTRVVAGFCCLAGFLATLVAQPLLLLAHGGAGTVH